MNSVEFKVKIMSYLCDLGNGQKIYLENQGNQTIITSVSQSLGQQQQSSQGFVTGTWSSLPQIYQLPSGIIVKVITNQGEYNWRIQGNNMLMNQGSILVENAQTFSLQEVLNPSISGMQPMKPMTMGNMSMNMNPMEMTMGNMSMKIEETPKIGRHFCSQCGSPIQENDKFCSNCGHRLS